MKRYYLFDFDGTLVDSMPTYAAATLRVLEENGVPYDDEVVRIITPLGMAGTADYYIRELGVKATKEEIIAALKAYMLYGYRHTIPAKANVEATLVELKRQGASLNVLTASPHATLDVCLQRLGLWDLFDNVWSCDDFNTTKADPQIYLRAAERMGTTVENVWFLDDNLNADLTAKAAGMRVCGVYDESSKDCVEEMKAATDRYIYDFEELLSDV